MLESHTNNRPFADKRDKVGMDGVPKDSISYKISIVLRMFEAIFREKHKCIEPQLKNHNCNKTAFAVFRFLILDPR